ncbi:MAG: carboxypeptidase regulatory-like domain-containing protein [Acidobacteriota bacterium]
MMLRKNFQLASLSLLALAVLAIGCGGGDSGESPAATGAEESATSSGGDAPTGTASISGTVSYEGKVPSLRPIAMEADKDCAAMHSEPVANESLVLGDGSTMANILVRVKGGLPSGSWPTPSEAVVMDQKGCKYVPHVFAVMVNQPIKILNSDGILHNVHALPKINREFNTPMPGAVKETTKTFDKVEDVFVIKCDVHPWMRSYVAVYDHPYFSVTQKDGQFSITGLPAGTYEIEAWHERLGTQTASVTLGDGESASQDFTFTRP